MFGGYSHFRTLLSLLAKANILADQTCHARIADFGLLTIISDPANLSCSSSYTQGGTARWMSPELIASQRFGFEKNRPTRSSDCYALRIVIYETVSGNLPFQRHGPCCFREGIGRRASSPGGKVHRQSTDNVGAVLDISAEQSSKNRRCSSASGDDRRPAGATPWDGRRNEGR